MIEIPLSRGKVALVDDEDYALAAHRWYAVPKHRAGGPPLWYAYLRDGTFMHRLIMGAQPGQEVDHINHDGLDNRRGNLRLATRSQNMMNARPKHALSKYKGVTFWRVAPHRAYWRAQIKAGAVRRSAYCQTERDAAISYNEMARELFGEFTYLNVVEG